ncbi:hypothetical protein BOTBODRAFT_321879 [Botryobasidium botryosum FD-172 SS1]|uniref:ATP-dependent DNA helicase n=1 Tax=Botryobasidium botryosum (strain FD-172 SS1) TaxID=930990 RepID=A0A067MYT6_BOTB1|nr:hypothetical protein BOTBODRAFT_321879 [Botryobasidium botryosum FD-172 SS1]
MSTSDKKARVARSKKAKVAADCYDVLTNVFEKTHYKGQQQEIVEAALEGEDILVVAPTGMGKSLCFQIPAIAAKNGITFVISPLLALMKNQVSRLRDHGVRAAALNSESSSEERSEITSDLASSNPQTRLLYITPEKMGTPSFQLSLSKLYNRGKITRFVLDEAHCISEWGHSFRIDYRNLGFLKKKYPLVPIMALTASATAIVREDIITNLNMSPSLLTFIHPFNRENLFYEVQYFKNPQPQSQYATVASYINNLTRRKGGEASTGIVYARRRETCDQLAEFLRRSGIAARAYHRGLSNAELDQTLTEWENEDQCKVVCATVAFGMGIDKANCRFVIHYDLPGSFEGFYQETGRAGRDGSASKCILYYSREDAIRVQKLVSRNHAAREQNDGPEPSQRAPESIQALINFAENTSVCRHVLICRYFGEVVDTSDEDVRKSYCNQMCDVRRFFFILV